MSTLARVRGMINLTTMFRNLENVLEFQVLGEVKELVTLVLTNRFMCLIKEDNVFWPLPQSNKIRSV